MTNPQRAGIFTSEFFVWLVSQIIGVLVLSGRLTPVEGQVLQNSVVPVFNAVVSVVTGLYMIYSTVTYIKGRVDLKKILLGGITKEQA